MLGDPKLWKKESLLFSIPISLPVSQCPGSWPYSAPPAPLFLLPCLLNLKLKLQGRPVPHLCSGLSDSLISPSVSSSLSSLHPLSPHPHCYPAGSLSLNRGHGSLCSSTTSPLFCSPLQNLSVEQDGEERRWVVEKGKGGEKVVFIWEGQNVVCDGSDSKGGWGGSQGTCWDQ